MGSLQGGPVGNEEKKVCLWPIGAGTTCGKTFSKFDSLKRHLAETHKGMFLSFCFLCGLPPMGRHLCHDHLLRSMVTIPV